MGEDSQTPALDFLWTSSYSSLPFADFALYSFAVINLTKEYGPAGTSSE